MSVNDLSFMTLEESFVKVKSKLLEDFSRNYDEEKDLFDKHWSEGIGKGDLNPIAAVDGGSRPVSYTQGRVLFLTSAAMIVKGSKLKRYRVYQFGVTDYYEANERIRYCREVLESKMARVFLFEHDEGLLLMDGSLSAPLEHRVYVTKYEFTSPSSLKYVLRSLIEEMQTFQGIKSYTHDLNNRERLQSEVSSSLSKLLGEGAVAKVEDVSMAMAFLERYEALESFKSLYEGALSGEVKLIGISKRSSSRRYFESRIPDIEIVGRLAKSVGYLKPKTYEVRLPDYVGNHSFPITLTYVKLEDNTPPMKVEVLGSIGESELLNILGTLRRYSVKGYPYHLRLVHEMAKISKDMVDFVLRSIETGPTGREWLGE